MVHLTLGQERIDRGGGGAGPIFKVSMSQLDAKERPGKLPMDWVFVFEY